MTSVARRLFVLLFALLAAMPTAFAQAQRQYSQPELDQMLAPVALYPDPLLSQVLMAATYPHEVAEAARWSRANPGLQGDDAVRAVQTADWDPSVQSLVAFPQILARMDENPAWTRSLGDAFLMQEPQVMDTVQQLRRRAQAAGNLQSSEQMYVQQQGQAILVQPASPQYVYVPYYDPLVVYGPWWWPAYRPLVWAPWPGYARHHRPGVSVGFWWGTPVGLSLNFFFGNFDWHQRHVRVAQPNAYYYRAAARENRTLAATPRRWQNDARRREVAIQRQAVQAPQAVQAQPAAQRQAVRAPAAAERQESRVERQQQRQQSRSQVNAQPSVEAPASVQLRPREERREERQADRVQTRPAAAVQAQPAAPVRVQPQSQPAAQPRSERREERREERRDERQAARVQTQPQQQQIRTQAQPAAAAARVQAPAAVQPQVRTPAASAPLQPSAERLERRELRQERRNERVPKGS